MLNNALNAFKAYSDEKVRDITLLSGGHINNSFLVTGKDRYVLQCLNPHVFADHLDVLEHNYMQYHKACEKKRRRIGKWCCPQWMLDRNGEFFFSDEEKKIWRLYRYIQSETVNAHLTPEEIFETGKGLGKLHFILKDCDIRPMPKTEALYDLFSHYKKYRAQNGSKMDRIGSFDTLIDESIEEMLTIYVPKNGNIHGDAKVSNMLFEKGKVIGFVDLDTMMPGSSFDDIADCVRSCCIGKNGCFEYDRIALLKKGYEKGSKTSFTDEASRLLDRNIVRNRFMLGLRYYTDYLSQEGYFKEEHPGQSLERAHELFGNV